MTERNDLKPRHRLAVVLTTVTTLGVLAVPFADASTPNVVGVPRHIPTHQHQHRVVRAPRIPVYGLGNWRLG